MNSINKSLTSIHYLINDVYHDNPVKISEKIEILSNLINNTLDNLIRMHKKGALSWEAKKVKNTIISLQDLSKKLYLKEQISSLSSRLAMEIFKSIYLLKSKPIPFILLLDIDCIDHNGSMLLTFIDALKREIPIIATHSLVCGNGLKETNKGNFLKLKEELIEQEANWYVFSKDEFLVFFPKNFLPSLSLQGKLNAMDLNLNEKSDRTSILKVLKGNKEKAKIYNLFTFFSNNPQARKLFFLNGHGGSKSSIGGISQESFKFLIPFLKYQNTAGFTIRSCYAGGRNSLLFQPVDRSMNAVSHLSFPVILQSIGEFSTCRDEIVGNNIDFFMNEVVGCMDKRGGLNSSQVQSIIKNIEKKKKKKWENEMQICFPHHVSAPQGFRPLRNSHSSLLLDLTTVRGSQLNLAKTEDQTSLCEVNDCDRLQFLLLDSPIEVRVKSGVPKLLSFIPGDAHHLLDSLILEKCSFDRFIKKNFSIYKKLGKVTKAFFIDKVFTNERVIEGFVLFASSETLSLCIYKEKEQYYLQTDSHKATPISFFDYTILWKKMIHFSTPTNQGVYISSGGQESSIAFRDHLQKSHLKEKMLSRNERNILENNSGLILDDFINLTLQELHNLFFWAAKFQQWTLCKELIEKRKIDINGRDITGLTPLCISCMEGQENLVSLLLENGADINLVDKTNKLSPLHFAINPKKKMPNIAIIKRLLQTPGIDLNLQDIEGWTPLAYAFHLPKLLEILLQRGSQTNLLSKNGVSLIGKATSHKNCTSLIDMILKIGKADIHLGKTSPLNIAIQRRNLKAVKHLLNCGADPFKPDASGQIPLIHLIQKGESAIVNELLEKNSNLPNKDSWLGEALIAAIEKRNSSLILFLAGFSENIYEKTLLSKEEWRQTLAQSFIDSLALKDFPMLQLLSKVGIGRNHVELSPHYRIILLKAIDNKKRNSIDFMLKCEILWGSPQEMRELVYTAAIKKDWITLNRLLEKKLFPIDIEDHKWRCMMGISYPSLKQQLCLFKEDIAKHLDKLKALSQIINIL